MAVNSTFVAKPAYIAQSRKWLLIDAQGETLGRLASRIAMLLRGKHKRFYTPNMDCGDKVIVINASKIKVTGKKLHQSKFFWHTGYPGGIKEKRWSDILEGSYPERLMINAVRRMLPKASPLARLQIKSLYVYPDETHPHASQQPERVVITKYNNS